MINNLSKDLGRLVALLLFSTGLGAATCSAQVGSIIKNIRFPSEVTMGDLADIEIDVDDKNIDSAVFQFGSKKQGPYSLFRYSSSNANETLAGSISAQVGRGMVIKIDSANDPKDGAIYWLRVSGTAGCELLLFRQDGSKERLWINAPKNKGSWRWVRVDALKQAAGITKISFQVPPVSDCILDCVASSKDPNFNPEGVTNDANKFEWDTKFLSVGRQVLKISVKADGETESQEIAIEVLPKKSVSE